MRNLTTTVAVVALLAGSVMWPATVTAQDNSALRNAIEAQQQQTLEAAGAATEVPVLLTEEELDDLVAPVALYPDALLAQVLVAAAYPMQVAKADQLIDASAEMGEDELSANLEGQEFDPSVLVLMSGFPTVVSRMAEDLDWTERLGQAMVAQDEDVLAAVQRMRAQADATGNLTSNAAQVIEREDDQIYIRPADPEVVYVPTYDPQTVYTSYTPTTPYVQPQSTTAGLLGNPLVAGALGFGGALLVQELFDDDDDHSNNNKNNGGWNDYWNGGRPIDWRGRQFYPRPVLHQGAERYTWGQERDRFWDRRAQRWQRDDQALRAYQAGRQDTLEAVMRDRNAQVERMREAAREAKADAEKRHERIQERRQDAAQRAKQEQAKADAQREDRLKAAEAAQKQREKAGDAAAKQDVDAKAAAQEQSRQRAQAQREDEARAARQEAQRKQAAQDAQAKPAQQNKAEQQRQEESEAEKKKQQRARAAQQQQDEAQAPAQRKDQHKDAEKKKQVQQPSGQKCKNNAKDKDCEDNN